MWTKAFWQDLAERSVASAAGGALTALGGGAVDLWTVDARLVSGFAAGAFLVSVLKGLAARLRGNSEDASLLNR